MTRAERRRLERDAKFQAPATLAVDVMPAAIYHKNKLWHLATIRKLVPTGAEPIATRYDPLQHGLHIACTDGSVHFIPWQDAEKAERDALTEQPRPIILDPNTLKPIETSEAILQQAQEQEAKRQRERQQQQRQQQQDPPEEWEVARARCAELEIKLDAELLCACPHGQAQGCHGSVDENGRWSPCDTRADVAMIKRHGLWRDLRGEHPVACETCARALLDSKRARLDCDPDATA